MFSDYHYSLQMKIAISILLVYFYSVDGMIEHIPLPEELQNCFSRYSEKTSIAETVGESITSFCFGQYIWKTARGQGFRGFNISYEAYSWAQQLLLRSDIKRHKRQAISQEVRVRKEYRRLTEKERVNFHRAVNMLKLDTSVLPNQYDALSGIHQGMMTTSAHGGPNFLGFHRIYLIMFENALRDKIPDVTVPYWDSTLDEPLNDPTQSVLFTEPFLGNGFGIVNSGPFAHWTTMSGPLIRNIGQSGQLFNAGQIFRIISNVRLAQITEPNAPVNSSLEFLHNQVHLWIDGQMGDLETAAQDPIFWLHHAYVDYVWELFRQNQRRFRIDPTRDYPTFVNNSMHVPGYPMGIADFRNIDGLSDVFTAMMYTYEPSPTCSQQFPDCGSPYLRCVMINFQSTCVTADWSAAPSFPSFRQLQIGLRSLRNMAAIQQSAFAMNAARDQLQMTMRNQGVQQQNPQNGLRQPVVQNILQQEALSKENENTGLDDPGESLSHMQKRSVKPHGKKIRNANRRIIRTVEQGYSPMMGSTTAEKFVQLTKSFIRKSNFQKTFIQNNLPNVQNASNVHILPPPIQPMPNTCPVVPLTMGYQNSFNINGRSDINQWVYIPVKVIYQRPPTFEGYASYPVINGEPDEEMDIYSLNAHQSLNSIMPTGKPASFSHCQTHSGAGKVFISSKGLNYMGTYKEYAVVDHRLAVSISTTYVAVRSPERGTSEAYINAYDSCGRLCQIYCKHAGTADFRPCSGAIRVSSGMPKLFGTNYGDAVTNLWHFDSKSENCPTIQDDTVYIQFHCSFGDKWPFGPVGSTTRDKHVSPEEAEESESKKAKQQQQNVSGSQPAACHIGNSCLLRDGCQNCVNGQNYECVGTCSQFTTCQNGVHHLQTCPDNTMFDLDEGKCISGVCTGTKADSWWQRYTFSVK